MEKQIRKIREECFNKIEETHNNCTNILEIASKSINIFNIDDKDMSEINRIKKALSLLETAKEYLEFRDIPEEGNLKDVNILNLGDDFTRKKIKKIIIGDIKTIHVKSATESLVKFCETLLEENSSHFLEISGKMSKLFSRNKEDLKDPKPIKGCDLFIGTKMNSNSIFRAIRRIAVEYGIDPELIKVVVN